jgi:hypothetical protein
LFGTLKSYVIAYANAATANLIPGLSFCVVLNLPTWFWAYWVPLLISEALLCALALPQTLRAGSAIPRSQLKSGIFDSTRRLVDVMIRDSLMYFLVYVAS